MNTTRAGGKPGLGRGLGVLAGVSLLGLWWAAGAGQAAGSTKPTYEYYVAGNAGNVTTPTAGGLVLMGGGTDVDDAFRWMIQKSGGGDFVVIRATGTDAYNPYVFRDLGGVDSAETLLIKSRSDAAHPFVVNKIRNAEALFIAGGDQNNYVSFWKGTPVEDALHELAARNVPIGGTSAGLAIMGEFLFPAANNTVDSPTALADPYGRRVVLDRDFLVLPHLQGVLTDSHFAARDRMGRLVTFLARLVQDGWAAEARGIGVDERTALLVEPGGSVSLVGAGAAYLLRTPGRPETCRSRTPLTYRNLSVHRMTGASTFQLSTWTGSGLTSYGLSAEAGSLVSFQPGGGVY